MRPSQYHPKQFHVCYKRQCPQESARVLLTTTETLTALPYLLLKKRTVPPVCVLSRANQGNWKFWWTQSSTEQLYPRRLTAANSKTFTKYCETRTLCCRFSNVNKCLTFSFFVYWMKQLSSSVRGQSIYSTVEMIKPKIYK